MLISNLLLCSYSLMMEQYSKVLPNMLHGLIYLIIGIINISVSGEEKRREVSSADSYISCLN